jgi:hypothetical protein
MASRIFSKDPILLVSWQKFMIMFTRLYDLEGQHTMLYPHWRNAGVHARLQDIRFVLGLCISLAYGCVCRLQKVSWNLSLLPQLQKNTSISPLIQSSVQLSVEGTH